MSLTDFIKLPDVAEKLKPFRPRLPDRVQTPIVAEPHSNRFTVVATAIDYLLRFEIQRVAPHAVTLPWIAEKTPTIVWKAREKGISFISLSKDKNGKIVKCGIAESDPDVAKEAASRMTAVINGAKQALESYLKMPAPSQGQTGELASHAIRLAKLDLFFRSRHFDSTFEEALQEDIEDLHMMLRIAPFESFASDRVVLLNPNFGNASQLVRGADADLISGDLLVDFKASKDPRIDGKDLDQLLGYFLLSRHHRVEEPAFPAINKAGLYFCRFGQLICFAASSWTDSPDFSEMERWFFGRAEQEHDQLEQKRNELKQNRIRKRFN